MYQTAGHALIPLYAITLQIPLYQHPIRGLAVNPRREYSAPHPRSASQADNDGTPVTKLEAEAGLHENTEEKREEEDETESLIPLLQHIKTLHPTCSAICSGAIFSTYQRTRLESVALRMNLRSLAPLWQYPYLPIMRPCTMSTPIPGPDGELAMLCDIATVGLDARIVKVASGGLDAGILWGDLRDKGTRERVQKGVERFGGSVVGEGGEFETLVLDGPGKVWKGGKIEVEEGEMWVLGGEGGEAWMGFGGGKVVKRTAEDEGEEEATWREQLAIPKLWDIGFERLVGMIEKIRKKGRMEAEADTCSAPCHNWTARPSVSETDSILNLNNLTAAAEAGSSAAAQMAALGNHLCGLLKPYSLAPTAILFTTLLLRSMTDFSSVNTVYSALFPEPLPPARVTVACGDMLPAGVQVMAAFTVDRMDQSGERQGLHVQSQSYWTPANIGPYSQAMEMRIREGAGAGVRADAAIWEPALVFVAGQIPLVPITMEPLETKSDGGDFGMHVCLALQHLWRIGKERGVVWWMGGVAYLVSRTGEAEGKSRAQVAWLAWRMAHEREFENEREDQENQEDEEKEEELDVWDRTYGGKGSFAVAKRTKGCLPDFEKIAFEIPNGAVDGTVPGFFAVQVDELPKGCPVEWQALGIKHDHVTKTMWTLDGRNVQRSLISTGGTIVSYIGIPKSNFVQSLAEELSKAIDGLCGVNVAEGRRHKEQVSLITVYTPYADQVQDLDLQIIPCRAVWGRDGAELVAGVVIVSETRE